MKGISNMQNNCSLLNSCIQSEYSEFKQDYCTLKEFDGQDLYFAMKCSSFFGFSGLISFNNASSLRSVTPMSLFQLQSASKVVKIAEFSKNESIFFNNEIFSNGQVPVSGNSLELMSLFH